MLSPGQKPGLSRFSYPNSVMATMPAGEMPKPKDCPSPMPTPPDYTHPMTPVKK